MPLVCSLRAALQSSGDLRPCPASSTSRCHLVLLALPYDFLQAEYSDEAEFGVVVDRPADQPFTSFRGDLPPRERLTAGDLNCCRMALWFASFALLIKAP